LLDVSGKAPAWIQAGKREDQLGSSIRSEEGRERIVREERG
jgi:hypothetical protein